MDDDRHAHWHRLHIDVTPEANNEQYKGLCMRWFVTFCKYGRPWCSYRPQSTTAEAAPSDDFNMPAYDAFWTVHERRDYASIAGAADDTGHACLLYLEFIDCLWCLDLNVQPGRA
jgi:hypothetical protein